MVNQSQFIEMFGDPITNSKKCIVKKGSELFIFSSGKANTRANLNASYKYDCFGGNGTTGKSKDYLIDFTTLVIGRVGEYCGSVHITPTYSWITDNAIYIKDFKDKDLDIKYLYYLFRFLDLHRLSAKTGQPKITQEALLGIDYICPSVEEQKGYVTFAHHADKSKFAGFKSQFIEETKRWSTRSTIGGLVDVNITKAGKKFKAESTIQYIDISSVDNASNTVLGATEYIFKDAPSRAQQCITAGDILVSTVRPNLKNIAVNHLSGDNLVASSGFCVLRPKGGYTGLLLAYIISDEFTEKMTLVAKGTNYPAVHDSDILDYEITVPEKDEVKRIDSLYRQADKSKYLN